MTSSLIANAGWQGGINLNVGGTLNVGGANSVISIGDTYSPKGIFTESGGTVSVLAQQAVNVNNSRIAAYNGGNVTVESVNSDVNAGDGGSGHVNVDAVQIDPASGALVAIPTVGVAGSGILATTIPGSDARLGNILVESPRGDIVASQGGILQIGLNGTDASAATAILLAGYELQDVNGNPALAQDWSLPGFTTSLVSPDRNVDASGSGIVAQNVVAQASGKVQGLFVGFGDVTLQANQIGSGLAFGHKVIVSSADPLTGGPGDAPTIQVISDNPVSVNGVSEVVKAPQTAAPTAVVTTTTEDQNIQAAKTGTDALGEDSQKKNGAKPIGLARKISRVTVLLPQKD